MIPVDLSGVFEKRPKDRYKGDKYNPEAGQLQRRMSKTCFHPSNSEIQDPLVKTSPTVRFARPNQQARSNQWFSNPFSGSVPFSSQMSDGYTWSDRSGEQDQAKFNEIHSRPGLMNQDSSEWTSRAIYGSFGNFKQESSQEYQSEESSSNYVFRKKRG